MYRCEHGFDVSKDTPTTAVRGMGRAMSGVPCEQCPLRELPLFRTSFQLRLPTRCRRRGFRHRGEEHGVLHRGQFFAGTLEHRGQRLRSGLNECQSEPIVGGGARRQYAEF